jgi:hypothetical protein
MPADREKTLSKLSPEELKSLGKQTFSKLEKILDLGDLYVLSTSRVTFPNSYVLDAYKSFSDEGKDIVVHVTENVTERRQTFLAFRLREESGIEYLHICDPGLSVEGENVGLVGTLRVGPDETMKFSREDQIGPIELGVKLVNWIQKSLEGRRLKPLDLSFKSTLFPKE